MAESWRMIRVRQSTWTALHLLKMDAFLRQGEGGRVLDGLEARERITDDDLVAALVRHIYADRARSKATNRRLAARRRQAKADKSTVVR